MRTQKGSIGCIKFSRKVTVGILSATFCFFSQANRAHTTAHTTKLEIQKHEIFSRVTSTTCHLKLNLKIDLQPDHRHHDQRVMMSMQHARHAGHAGHALQDMNYNCLNCLVLVLPNAKNIIFSTEPNASGLELPCLTPLPSPAV